MISRGLGLASFLGGLALVAGFSFADPPRSAPAAPSSYAPAADLVAQVDYYMGRISDALASPAEYDADKQSRVDKDANTVAALALVLGQHDQKNKYQAASAGMIAAAQRLAAASADAASAARELAALKAASQVSGEPAPWGEVASLPALMKQVPIVNNSLRRGLDPAKFKKQKNTVAEQAATLAAIAEASWHDTSNATDVEDTAAWRKYCVEMRDAAAAVNTAAHESDVAAAGVAAKRLALSCDGCHAKFRQ